MPVAAVLGDLDRHHHEVAEADWDVLQAPRAEVFLARLKRVDERDLEVFVAVLVHLGIAAHSTNRIITSTAAATST